MDRPLDSFVGKKVDDMFDATFAQTRRQHRERALETGETQLWEFHRRVDGGERHYEARFAPSGKDEVLVAVRDITERIELQRHVSYISERERRRIGHDLHDGLGQKLTGLSLSLKVLLQIMESEGSTHAERVKSLTAMTQDAVAECGRLARALAPGVSKTMDIAAALAGLALEVNEYPGVECTVECSTGAAAADPETQMHLYRIAQESVSNALRHGRARNIRMRYDCDGHFNRLEVLDDGNGIPPESERLEGIGLKSMRHRAQIINGSVEVAALSTGGTRVYCICPCAGS